MGEGRFNLVELGPGCGEKTQILVEAARRLEKEFEYIGIDISESANQELGGRLEQMAVKSTILTAEYMQGLEWVATHTKDRNVIVWLGGSISSLEVD